MRRATIVIVFAFILQISISAFALTSEELSNIRVFEESSPSVVNITTTTLVRDFFSVYPQKGAGSGTIIRKDGYVLTNYHVVEDAGDIQVTLSDGRKYAAFLAGADPENDLAVIKIKSKRYFKPISMGRSSDLRVGQKAFAIGNPFGLNSTLTTGVISAVGRPLTTESGRVIENVIQTDTSINPGNSGGPLINSDGKLIGINTAIFSPSGGSVGIGFAIPIDTAKRIIPDLIKYGKLRRPWLGIVGVPVWKELADALGLGIDKGILVSKVVKGGPADHGGMKGGTGPVQISGTIIYVGGDIITEIDGHQVNSMEELKQALFDKREGRYIRVRVFRKGRFKVLKIRVRLKT